MAHGNRMSISNAAVVAVRPALQLVAGQLSATDMRAVSDWIRLNEAARSSSIGRARYRASSSAGEFGGCREAMGH